MSTAPGREASIFDEDDVATPSLAARLHLTLGHPPRRFRAGELAPAGLHWCLAPEAGRTDDLGADGLARHGIIPELDLPRRMWAGAVVEMRRPLRVGDAVRRQTRVAKPVRKRGRAGPLAFVEITHDYRVGGEIAVSERQTIVYKPAADGTAASAPSEGLTSNPRPRHEDVVGSGPEAPAGRLLREIETDPLQLFRFSALTFNTHLIHVDRDFARAIEGYADILVHGTLTAALLLDAALSDLADKPWRAEIRALAPLHCGPLAVWSRMTEDGQIVDAVSAGRPVMSAVVRVPA